ncbi:MAG: beta-galactosidase, partial [Eubacteriales bacterium]
MRLNPCIRRAETAVLPAFGDKTITVTNRMLLKNGTPVLPVMGELHYSRVPAECWKEELQKMKDGGVDIVASYVFWIHHEESKGCFDFSGNRNLRRFVELCHEVGLDFCLRIGPWAHGECRNGGFPDWLQEECPDTLRSSDEPYIGYVRRFLCAVAEQVRGLPLIGIQVENEMTYRPEYLEEIRKIVLETGLHAPLLTATGWGQARLPETLLPMFGGYPEAPWEGHTRPLAPNNNYLFSYQREDSQIGSDLLKAGLPSADKYEGRFPYLTCEVGGGNQVTYHRRPFFTARDIEALVLCKIGSGVNLLGYYMYHGGINPVGKTTMQESRET